MVKDVGERVITPDEVSRYAAIIREEHALLRMENPSDASDEDILKMMDTLRNRK